MALKTWSRVGGSALASTPGNWSGGTLPQNGDDLLFDATSVLPCTWDLSRNLNNVNIEAGYSGAISMDATHAFDVFGIFTQNGGTFNKHASQTFQAQGGFTQGGGVFNNSGTMSALVSMLFLGGTFNGGPKPSAITSDGVNIAGGVVTGPNGTWSVRGTFLKGAGTFIHNTMTLALTGSTHGVVTGGALLYNTSIQKTGAGNVSIAVGQTCPFIGLGPYSLSMGSGTITVSGTITAEADIAFLGGGFLAFAAGSSLEDGVSHGIDKLSAFGGGILIDPAASIPGGLDITFSPLSSDTFFDGGDKTFGTFTRSGPGAGKVTFVQHGFTASIFRDNDPVAVAHVLEFQAGLVFSAKWRVRGLATGLLTIQSDTPDSVFFMTGPAGEDIESDYLVVKDSFAGPGIFGYAGTHSTNAGGNVNWFFTDSPHVGRIALDWRTDGQGMPSCVPPRLQAVAGRRIELAVTYKDLVKGSFPVTYESPSILPDVGYLLRWIGKRHVNDDDSSALFDVSGEFVENAVGIVSVPAASIPDGADEMYTELILTSGSGTENVSARVPLWMTLSKAGVA